MISQIILLENEEQDFQNTIWIINTLSRQSGRKYDSIQFKEKCVESGRS
jgi:hypothetical protein